MKHSALSSLSVLSLFIGTLSLVGCGGAASFSNSGSATPPPAETTPNSVAGPAVEGNVYGGHAPIQNAHVYLAQPGTTGYGSAATSLLGNNGATSANGYVLTANGSDPNVPAGAKYVTTDANGAFSLTGAYTCVIGQPVYIYAYGGNFGGSTTFNRSIVQLATLGNCPSSGNFSTAGNGALQYVFLNEVSTVATAYTFQPFTLVTNNDAWHIGSSGTTQALLGIANAANTAAQLYSIQGGGPQSTIPNGEGHNANYRTTSTTFNGFNVVTTPNAGNGVVPEATIDSLANILADCVDSTPTTGTPVTAQCTALFAIATNDGLVSSSTNKPVDTGTAAINIARFPAGNHSNGTANVNAGYVTGLYGLQAGGPQPYIPQLSHAPNDWTVAINYPNTQVGGYTTTNSDVVKAESVQVDNLGQLWITAQGTGNGTSPAPSADRWSPLGVPNAFNSSPGNYIFGYVSIDGGNNAWTGNANSTSGIYYAGSNGAFNTVYGSGYTQAYTLITNNGGDAFFFAQGAGTGSNYGMWEYLPGGTLAPGSPFNISDTTTTTPGTLTITSASASFGGGTYTYTFQAANSATNPLVAGDTVTLTMANHGNWPNLNGTQTVVTANATQFTVTGNSNQHITGTSTGTAAYSHSTTTAGALAAGTNVGHGAIDSTGDMWITSEGGNSIARITPTGSTVFPRITTAQQPEFPAIDNSGNAWIAIQETASQIYVVTPSGGQTILTSATTGAELTSTFGAAVDGNGNIWFANRCGNYGACGSTPGENSIFVLNGGSSTPGIAQTAISPRTNYTPEAQYPANATSFTPILNGSLNLAIDPSGNLWITNYTGNSVVELVGAAAPVATPLSVAAANNALGAKP
jgi:streptogramin lyase